jgi:hypothetical protein
VRATQRPVPYPAIRMQRGGTGRPTRGQRPRLLVVEAARRRGDDVEIQKRRCDVPGGRNERKVPKTLEEAYELRDASATPDGQDFYQQLVYRLRAEEYRSRNINTAESVRRRERSRNEARRVEDGDVSRSWWERVFARRK